MPLDGEGAEKTRISPGSAEGGGQDSAPRWAFRENGPWELRIEELSWRSDLESIREGQRARVPQWLAQRRWPPEPPEANEGPIQEEKNHTDTINHRFPRKYGNIWEVGGKTRTQNI